jgi:hypothetical protein
MCILSFKCTISIEAIHLRSKFEKVPEMEIALVISKWMAQASNRLKRKCIIDVDNINYTVKIFFFIYSIYFSFNLD